MSKQINVSITTLRDYAELLNPLFGLTDTELEVLGGFIKAKVAIDKSNLDVNPFSTEVKKEVAEDLGREDFNTLNTYIKRLKDKNAIIPNQEGYQIHPAFIPDGSGKILFNINNKSDN